MVVQILDEINVSVTLRLVLEQHTHEDRCTPHAFYTCTRGQTVHRKQLYFHIVINQIKVIRE